MKFKLAKGEHIVTAFAETASGPGWSNTPIWIIVQDANGSLRRECLQPDEQSEWMRWLYTTSEVAHVAMSKAVAQLE